MARLIHGSLPVDVARSVLHLDFSKRDHERMARLQRKASEGTLTARDQELHEEYLRAADMLAILQSRARRSLKRQKGA
jgi:hypothetical protein